ncbi:MAG TPA: CUB domain-containing protein, partial [Saprospiraceae bacterium]|nr:CUB domain-containing protein [Saprospiraceae bacterium]
MNRIYFLLVICFAFNFWSVSSFGQTEYTMQNLLVTDCEGILTDSDNGPEDGQYDHNEDYTFTVCVQNATEIIIAFQFFSSEETYDVLNVYDGPNSGSPLLAMLTGSIQPPPVLVATSGCVTFHFTSDDNIVAAGWELMWSVDIEDPVPPVLQLLSLLDCPMPAMELQFDFPVDCDMMSAANFTLLGPGGPSIAQINPLDCTSGGLGQHFEVIFSSPLVQPGIYRLLFNGSIQDACGEWHDVGANIVFELMNCPFNAAIELDKDACEGDCGTVSATIIGDAGVPYQYTWSHTPLNQATVDVCTDIPVLISLTVTDPVSLQTATAQYTYLPLDIPVILNPIGDTVCSSRGDHIYQSNLPGGMWYSTIIPDYLRAEGRYQFWRWTWELNLNRDIVTYVAPNGCVAYDTVYVYPVNAGSIEAACLNSGDFMVNGGNPTGGTWQGPNISSAGIFSPIQAGPFNVTYTAPNGCVAGKRINVQVGITMPNVDTLCSSQEFDLVADPYGGTWSGPGVVN